jgi:uncharacterized protein YdaU (DUF1376 family)
MSNAWGAFYWGDYIADTGHLTLAQHGAYLLLMAHYYRTRRPLPANAPVLHRVCRCTTDADRCAVNEVLQEFFTLDGDVYRQSRIDRELAKAIDISEKRSVAARAKHEKRAASARANGLQVHTQPQPQPQSQPQLERKPSAANASVADDRSEPVGICNKVKVVGTNQTWEGGREVGKGDEKPSRKTAQPPSEIIPPHTPEGIKFHAPPIIETPDGLHSNQYATRLLEEINFLPVPKYISAVTAAIDYEAKAMGVMSAYEFVLEWTRYAMLEECEINAVFFTDRKYRPERRNSNQRQVSTHVRPTGNTQRNDALSDDSNPDPRHAPVRELIQQMHLKQFRVRCQWDGSEGKALDRLLSTIPSWSQEQIAQMVRNRFESEGIPPDRPRKWLPNIGSYAAGRLDRFSRLKGVGTNEKGNENRAERRQADNIAAGEEAIAIIRRRMAN